VSFFKIKDKKTKLRLTILNKKNWIMAVEKDLEIGREKLIDNVVIS
jgi:hypothetical protein